MTLRPRSTCLAVSLVLFADAAVAASAAGPPPALVCDASTALTPIGIDTSAGSVLLSLPPLAGGEHGWVVELNAGGAEAAAYPDTWRGRQGGSVGPGPVAAAMPCGETCLQPVRWNAGVWEPLGEPLAVPGVMTAGATYDLTGSPWLVIHGKAAGEGLIKAWGYRLEGHQWKRKGSLDVTAVGDLPAVPAPQRKDGVISGTGLFAGSGPAETWVRGLPDLPAKRRGQLIALGGGGAAYLSADGVVYLSPDSGKSWRRSTWTPWGAGTTGIWRQGSDYWVDLPMGDRRGPLQLAWFDRRVPNEEKIVLTRLSPAGDWIALAEARSEIHTKNDDRLQVSHVLAPEADTWVLLSGCAGSAGGSGLVLRVFAHGALSEARFVPIRTKEAAAGKVP
ncbi:MAG TPA: hypothetical protein VOA87_07380 [Thermoanaerobaculia bacterium]|nr:hypothetical protein [Thermoanaerobaculia bacterium]